MDAEGNLVEADAPEAITTGDKIDVMLTLTVEGQGEIKLEVTAPRALTFIACNRLVEAMKDKVREMRIEAERAAQDA